VYLLLAIPAAYGIFLVQQEQKAIQYSIFLGIFLAYLLLEWLFDFVLKINFRENWKKNWKFMVPYLGLYYAINYGFVRMPWKTSVIWGIIMLGLFIIQIIANLRSHPKISG
jgi:ABC-type antimicrobial peptide transport system permease subunit